MSAIHPPYREVYVRTRAEVIVVLSNPSTPRNERTQTALLAHLVTLIDPLATHNQAQYTRSLIRNALEAVINDLYNEGRLRRGVSLFAPPLYVDT